MKGQSDHSQLSSKLDETFISPHSSQPFQLGRQVVLIQQSGSARGNARKLSPVSGQHLLTGSMTPSRGELPYTWAMWAQTSKVTGYSELQGPLIYRDFHVLEVLH